jgi:hypothetical protein
MPVRFPAKRPDGTFTIAAAFDGPPGAAVRVKQAVQDSIRVRIGRNYGVFDAEFSALPTVELRGDEVLVIFDGRRDAVLWKDWLVAITEDVSRDVDGVHLIEFRDLPGPCVAGCAGIFVNQLRTG